MSYPTSGRYAVGTVTANPDESCPARARTSRDVHHGPAAQQVRTMFPGFDTLDRACTPERGIDRDALQEMVSLAVEIAREGREGRKIGTLFVIGDVQAVLHHSKPLILDPLR